MPNRNPTSMTSAEITAEITQLRGGVDSAASRIYELAHILHDRTRRQRSASVTPDPSLDVYVTYANYWSRFAGMVRQGLQRTRQADRLLRMLRTDEQAQQENRATQEPRGTRPQPSTEHSDQANGIPAESALKDLLELFGEESAGDAARQRPR